MKKTIKDLAILLLVLWAGYNILINFYMTPFINKTNSDIKYMCIVSLMPNKLTFVNFQYGNFESLLLTVDVYLEALIKKDFSKLVNGVSAAGFKYSVINGAYLPKEEAGINPAFVIPFCRHLDASFGKITYVDLDAGAEFTISGVSGGSTYYQKEKKDEELMAFELKGFIQGKRQDTVRLKFFFFPYYANRFNLNIYGTNIDVKAFEPLFKKSNLKIDAGNLNFIVQITGEMRKIKLQNQMEFHGLRIHEDTGPDLKALFGVSYEQMGKYLADSKGSVYVNFDLAIDDSQFGRLPALYANAFTDNLGNRVKMGILTAPVRQVTDLIWNLTGENIFRIFRLFGGQ
jgi:hypothetical protein